MKTTNTDEILNYIAKSPHLVLKILMGTGQKPLWCPSFKAQNSHDPQQISDSIWETFANADFHCRMMTSVNECENSDYSSDHQIIGTSRSVEHSNITPDFIEVLAQMMTRRWENEWRDEHQRKLLWEMAQYGADHFHPHLINTPTPSVEYDSPPECELGMV